jgi:hypothetical protein
MNELESKVWAHIYAQAYINLGASENAAKEAYAAATLAVERLRKLGAS